MHGWVYFDTTLQGWQITALANLTTQKYTPQLPFNQYLEQRVLSLVICMSLQIAPQWSADECSCPVALIKEYLVMTNGIEHWSDKLITRSMCQWPVSNATIATWLNETLILTNIRTSQGSTTKASASNATRQGASIKIIEAAGDLAHTSKMYGHYITCLPREVLVRILE